VTVGVNATKSLSTESPRISPKGLGMQQFKPESNLVHHASSLNTLSDMCIHCNE
jgi:hypothetical protein